MAAFAAGLSQHPLAAEAVGEVVGQVLDGLAGESPDLAVLFLSAPHVDAAEDIAGSVRSLLDPAVLVGCTAMAVIAEGREAEDSPGIALLAGRLPGAALTTAHLHAEPAPDGATLVGWPEGPGGALILLADPFTFPSDLALARVADEQPAPIVIGGLASASTHPGGNRLVLDDRVLSEGAVGVLVAGAVGVTAVVSQGCRPIGRPYVVTQAQGNVIEELGGAPALARLAQTCDSLAVEDRMLLEQGLHIGLVVDERREVFERGDFLVRNVVGIDRSRGAVAIGDFVEVGRTVQFHVRDAASADEDLREMLSGGDARAAEAALLFTCTGRGQRLFGVPDHDAELVERLLGPLPLAGMFCAGELGPVGGRNFLHGFTASLALFRS